jgi:tRNA nucleotidyltransferase/poly(A) polymerase
MAVKLDFDLDPATVEAIRGRAESILTVPVERVSYELWLIFSAGRFRRAIELLDRTWLDVVLFGKHFGQFPRDDLSVAAAFALLVDEPRAYAERWRWSDALLRDVLTLQRLARDHSLIALYEAGEHVARQLSAMLNEEIPMPDFATQPLLTGDAIASLTGANGPEIGRLKRALLDAQLRGEVRTREEAERYLVSSRA